jgi:hypothetical protein
LIDDMAFAEISRDVHRVQRGDWLTTDRVADRVDECWEVVAGLGMHGDIWAEAVKLDPAKARTYADHLHELQFLLGQIRDHHEDPAAIDRAYDGRTGDITQEVVL